MRHSLRSRAHRRPQRRHVPAFGPRAYAKAAAAALLLALTATSACKKPDAPVETAPAVPLKNVAVRDTPIVIAVPKDWTVDKKASTPLPGPPRPDVDAGEPRAAEPGEPDAGPDPSAGAAPTRDTLTAGVPLTGRRLLEARAPAGPGGPGLRVHVFQDPWLPIDTALQDYIMAQRASTKAAVGVVKNVNTERTERGGHLVATIRDTVGTGQNAILQVALLFFDSAPDDTRKHGYTVVFTMAAKAYDAQSALVQRMLDGVTLGGS